MMLKPKRLLWLLPLAVFMGMALMLWSRLGVDPTIVPQATTGRALMPFQLPRLSDGRVLTNADLPRQPFVLNVWGSWCPTCAVEHPYLMQLAQQGVIVVGVNYKDQAADAVGYLAARGNPFLMNLQDLQGDFGVDLGVTGAPESFVVDAQHRIRLHLVGELNAQVWQTQLRPCLDSLKRGGTARCSE